MVWRTRPTQMEAGAAFWTAGVDLRLASNARVILKHGALPPLQRGFPVR
jgi:hypothetical protein